MATSAERHEARYQRRKAKREARRMKACGKSFDEVMSFANLARAGKKCCSGSRWKTSTICFEANLLAETQRNFTAIHNGTRKFRGFRSFITIEHGKARNIDALPIKERAIQKCFCENFLVNAYSRSFIYDNGASLKDKGMDFMLRRLKEQLHHHYRKYGLEGGILQFDFSNYFGSLPHEKIKARARKVIPDDRLYKLFCDFADEFQCMGMADPDAEIKRGVGLGSEVSQIIALDYASPIDHYVKDTRGIHGYGRYMDDGFVISDSLAELEDIRECLYRLAASLDIRMNEKKCIITPFKNHGFTFLKMRFCITKTGRVIMKLSRKSIRAIRRKLDIFRRWLAQKKMGAEDAIQSYQSWRAHAKRCDSFQTLKAMDRRFAKAFAKELAERKLKVRCTLKAVKTKEGWIYREYERKAV